MNVTRIAVFPVLILAAGAALAQQPQIPSLQVCNATGARGEGGVTIASRADSLHSGSFHVRLDVKCDPTAGYPGGTLTISDISMSDSIIQGTITATSFEQMTSTGKHTPALYVNGRCQATGIRGCRYWLMIADNQSPSLPGTPDVVSFLVFDGTGNRVAYGTGPLADGDLDVDATSN